MDKFSEMVDAIQDDVTADDNSTFYSLALIKRVINRAKRKVEALYRWPALEDAKKTSTIANQEYYDYPQSWRDDSIWKVWVDSDDNNFGDPLVFGDYLYEKENDFPAGDKYIWANHNRKFFIQVNGVAPTSNGDNNIKIWGIKVTAALSADDDTTIFSYSMPEVNEAIVMEAVKILKSKGGEEQTGQMLSTEAKGIIALAWSRLKQDKAREEKTTPLLEVEDMFKANKANRKDNNIGKFE